MDEIAGARHSGAEAVVNVGVKHTTKKNEFPSMRKRVDAINGKGVEVGVLQGEHAWLASIHEYGCVIRVTPKMRAYLHGQGLHLKESTTHITIPERAFLRTGYDEAKGDVMEHARQMMADVINGTMSEDTLFKAVGMELADAIKDYARDLDSPPNHPFTVERKGSSNPLVDTGDMIGSITWRKAK